MSIPSTILFNLLKTYKKAMTPLMIAAQQGDESMVQVLLKKGAEVNKVRADGVTALMLAAEYGYFPTVKLLLEHKAEVTASRSDGATALLAAAQNGHLMTVKILLEYGAEVTAVRSDGTTALMLAAHLGHETVVQILLGKDAHNHVNKARMDDGMTALMFASQEGHDSVVEILLKSSAELAAVRSDGATALMLAVRNGHASVVQILLKGGIKINQVNKVRRPEGDTALIIASEKADAAMVEILLQSGAETNFARVDDGATALIIASQHGHISVVRTLLKAIYNTAINQTASGGVSALIVAAQHGHLLVVLTLLEKKDIAVNHARSDGVTALMLAAQNGFISIVEALLKADAGVNQANKKDMTALMSAAMHGHASIVQVLLEAGANVHQTRSGGATALKFALHAGHAAVVQIIRAHLASHINEIQKYELKCFLIFPVRDITETFEDELPQAINALSAMISSEDISKEEVEFFEEKKVWESILQVRAILAHPCPQNRQQGYLLNNTVFYWLNGDLKPEQQGLLGLTARDDTTKTPAITKEAVVKTIQDLIAIEVEQLKMRIVHTYVFPSDLDKEIQELLSEQGARIIKEPLPNPLGIKMEMPSHKLDKQLREKTGMHRVAVQKSKLSDAQLEIFKTTLPEVTIEEENPRPGEAVRWLITASKKIFPEIEKILNPHTASTRPKR